jgi:hypothetical protein
MDDLDFEGDYECFDEVDDFLEEEGIVIDDLVDDAIELPLDEPQKLGRTDSVLASHLSGPIIYEEVNQLLEFDNFYCHRHINWKTIIRHKEVKNNCNPWKCLRDIIQMIGIKDPKETFFKIYTTAQKNLNIQKGHFKSTVEKTICNTGNIPRLLELYNDKIKAEFVKDQICTKRIPFGTVKDFLGLKFDSDLLLFKCQKHQEFNLVPTNILLGVLDLMQSAFSMFLYWDYATFLRKYPTIHLFNAGDELYKKLLNASFIMGDDFYKVMKLWEPVATGYIITKPDDLGFKDLFDSTSREINQILKDHEDPFTLDDLLLLKYKDRPDHAKLLLELTGMCKCFGHPKLSILEGLEKVRKYAFENKEINEKNVKDAVGMFVWNWGNAYYKLHKVYPFINVPDSHPLKDKIQSNLPIHYDEITSFSIGIWADVDFDNVLEFDYSVDTLDLLKDSSLCSTRPNWYQDYDHCAFMNLHNQKKPRGGTPDIKRTILQFLLGDAQETKRKIVEVDEGYTNIERDGIAVLCPKEQELSGPAGRPFLKQTYYQRLNQTCKEKNIATKVMPYSKDQMMTVTELELEHRKLEAVKGMTEGLTMINIDFVKWNLQFRHELVMPFGKKLDQLFGMKSLYTYEHTWFWSAVCLSNNRMTPPRIGENLQPEIGEYCHKSHLGGFEGMNQKKWTLITQSAIRVVALRHNLKVFILGQGDNQVIIIKFNKHQLDNQEELRIKFVDDLSDYFKTLGHELKKEETWCSKQLFDFGKVRQYKGQAVSYSTKKLSRLISDINDGVECWSGSLSTISTLTEAGAKGDYCPDASFFIYGFETLHFLNRKKMILDFQKTNLINYLLFPSIFGGFSLSNYFNHFIRGLDDPLTYWIDLYQYLANQEEYRNIYMDLTSTIDISPPHVFNKEPLIHDIFAIACKPLPNIEKEMKDHVLTYLNDNYVKLNPEISTYFAIGHEQKQQELINNLLTMKPFMPSLAHELFVNSVEGQILKLQARLSNVQTINKIVQSQELDFVKIISDNNKRFRDAVHQIFRRKRIPSVTLVNRKLLESYICSTQCADHIRSVHWGEDIIGVTQPVPMCQVRIYPVDNVSRDNLDKSIIIETSLNLQKGECGATSSVGPFPTYIGSQTKQKVTKPKLISEIKTSFTSSLKRLVLLHSWLSGMGCVNLVNCTESLILQKLPDTTYRVSDLTEWTGSIWGGNLFHRFTSDLQRNSAIINHVPNIGSQVRFCTDLMVAYSKGGEDYTIFFQLVYLYSQCRILISSLDHEEISPKYAAIIACPGCTRKIEERDLDIDGYPFDAEGNEWNAESPILQHMNFQPIQKSDMDTANIDLSIQVGFQCGKEFENVNYSFYNDLIPSGLGMPDVSYSTMNLTEFRYVNFDYMFLGLILQSRQFRNYIEEPFSILSRGLRGLVTFSQFLILSDSLQKFLYHCDYSSSNHNELTKSSQTAVLAAQAIRHCLIKNRRRYLILLLGLSIDDQEISLGVWYKVYRILGGCPTPKVETLNKGTISRLQEENKISTRIFTITLKSDTPSFVWRKYMQDKDCTMYIREKIKDKYVSRLSYYGSFNLDIILTIEGKLRSISSHDKFEIKNIHHLGRPLGNISSSASKLYPLFAQTSDSVGDGLICCLAEGSGSMIHMLAHMFPNDLAYNTLLNSEIDNRSSTIDTYPPALTNDPCNFRHRFHFQDRLCLGVTDIMDRRFIRKIRAIFSAQEVSLITIDAESKTDTNNFEMLQTYFDLWQEFHSDQAVIIVKVFIYDKNKNVLDEILTNIISRGYFVRIDKPLNSHINNREYYISVTTDNCGLSPLTIDEACSISSSLVVTNFDQTILYSKVLIELSKKMGDSIVNQCLVYKGPIDLALNELNACNFTCSRYLKALQTEIIDLHNHGFSKDNRDKYTYLNRDVSLSEKAQTALLDLAYCYFRSRLPFEKTLMKLRTLSSIHLDKRKFMSIDFFENWDGAKGYFKLEGQLKKCIHTDFVLSKLIKFCTTIN